MSRISSPAGNGDNLSSTAVHEMKAKLTECTYEWKSRKAGAAVALSTATASLRLSSAHGCLTRIQDGVAATAIFSYRQQQTKNPIFSTFLGWVSTHQQHFKSLTVVDLDIVWESLGKSYLFWHDFLREIDMWQWHFSFDEFFFSIEQNVNNKTCDLESFFKTHRKIWKVTKMTQK